MLHIFSFLLLPTFFAPCLLTWRKRLKISEHSIRSTRINRQSRQLHNIQTTRISTLCHLLNRPNLRQILGQKIPMRTPSSQPCRSHDHPIADFEMGCGLGPDFCYFGDTFIAADCYRWVGGVGGGGRLRWGDGGRRRGVEVGSHGGFEGVNAFDLVDVCRVDGGCQELDLDGVFCWRCQRMFQHPT